MNSRDLRCPYCGYVLENNTGIGAVYCGPHKGSDGIAFYPAVRMTTIREDEDECATAPTAT